MGGSVDTRMLMVHLPQLERRDMTNRIQSTVRKIEKQINIYGANPGSNE